MPRKKDTTVEELEQMRAALEADIVKLELKRAVPEGTAELPRKGRGADQRMLTDGQKAIPVEGLRPAHRLKDLLEVVGLAKASHRHQARALAKPTSTQTSASACAGYSTTAAAARVPSHPLRLEGRGDDRVEEGRLPYHD